MDKDVLDGRGVDGDGGHGDREPLEDADDLGEHVAPVPRRYANGLLLDLNGGCEAGLPERRKNPVIGMIDPDVDEVPGGEGPLVVLGGVEGDEPPPVHEGDAPAEPL